MRALIIAICDSLCLTVPHDAISKFKICVASPAAWEHPSQGQSECKKEQTNVGLESVIRMRLCLRGY